MTMIDGIAVCVICRDTFELGHHYEFHVSVCRSQRRQYVKMHPEDKKRAIDMVEGYMREYLPGVLIGHGETI